MELVFDMLDQVHYELPQQLPHQMLTLLMQLAGQDDFWLPIAAAFAHEKGDGFNVILLQALPISTGDGTCKIVLRPPKDDKDADDERTKQAVRQANDSRRGRER